IAGGRRRGRRQIGWSWQRGGDTGRRLLREGRAGDGNQCNYWQHPTEPAAHDRPPDERERVRGRHSGGPSGTQEQVSPTRKRGKAGGRWTPAFPRLRVGLKVIFSSPTFSSPWAFSS